MDVVGQGDSEEEAIDRMKTEVAVLFDFCSERGTLADVLAHRSSRYSPPVSILRDVRLEGTRPMGVHEEPEWTSFEIDPAIMDSVMHGDLKARES
jgi:hypothetical protein